MGGFLKEKLFKGEKCPQQYAKSRRDYLICEKIYCPVIFWQLFSFEVSQESFYSVFEAADTDQDKLTETVTSYISFCEDMCVPTRTYLTFNNNKLWFNAKLKQLRQAKEDTYRSGDKALDKQAKYTLNR